MAETGERKANKSLQMLELERDTCPRHKCTADEHNAQLKPS